MTIEHTMKIQNLMRLIQPDGWSLKEARETETGNIVAILELKASKTESAPPREGEGE